MQGKNSFRSLLLRISVTLYKMFIVLCIICILFANLRLYSIDENLYKQGKLPNDIFAQLNFLKEQLQNGKAEEMQQLFPEGYFFTYILYSLAWTEIGLREVENSNLKKIALKEARWGLAAIDSEKGRSPFYHNQKPSYGIFYKGWLNWLRGGVLKLQKDLFELNEMSNFLADCSEIADAFNQSSTPFLTSYTNSSWPVDSVIGIAVLALHDHMFTPKYEDIILNWIAQARSKVDIHTGLLPHYTDEISGETITGSRGSSQSVIQRFLPEISEEWSKEQYILFRNQYMQTFLGLPGTKEYPSFVDGVGDIDSGPLVFGFSASATVVTIGAAKVHNDYEYLNIMAAIEMLGVPFYWEDQKIYGFGILPVGDAFLAWSKTATLWTRNTTQHKFSSITGKYWRPAFHIFSFFIVILLLLPMVIQRFFRYKNRRALQNEN